MALADKLSQKFAQREGQKEKQEREAKAAQAQAEVLEKQETEESHLTSLRQSIGAIDLKAEHMRSLLIELKQTHERAGASVAEAKKEGKVLKEAVTKIESLFKDERLRAGLAEEGINSVDDLLASYSEDEESKAVKVLKESRTAKRQTARSSISERQDVKVKAGKALGLPKLTYPSISVALESMIQELEKERITLFHQTPEGQESLKREIFEKIKKQNRFYENRTFTLKQIDETPLVQSQDLKEATEYPEAYVKEAFKKFYEQLIDQEMAVEAKKTGLSPLQEAVKKIEDLPTSWENIERTVQKIKSVKSKITEWIVELLGKKTDYPFFRFVNNYGTWNESDPEVLAQRFVQQLEKDHFVMLGVSFASSTEGGLERMIVDQKNLAKLPETFDTVRAPFFLVGTNVSESGPNATKFVNPEPIAALVGKKMEFYTKLDKALSLTFDEIFKKIKDGSFFESINVKFTHDQNIKDQLCFDGKTYATLRDGRWPNIKDRLEQQQHQFEEKAKTVKEAMTAKVEADWNTRALSDFLENEHNHLLVTSARRLLDFRKKAETWSSDLTLLKLDDTLKKEHSEQVQFDESGRLSFLSTTEIDLKTLHARIDALEKEIRVITQQIQAVDERASKEGYDFLGSKKKKREEEKQALEKKQNELRVQVNVCKNDYQPKINKNRKLDPLRSWLLQSRIQGFVLAVPMKPLSLKELFDFAEKQMDVQLSPEQATAYERYKVLVQKRDEAVGRYQKAKR